MVSLRSVRGAELSPAGTHVAVTVRVPRIPGVDEDGPHWYELHVVPFAGGGESEQSLRAQLFAARGLVTPVAPEALSAPALADAIERCLSRAAQGAAQGATEGAAGARAGEIAMDGATRTAEIVSRLVARRPGGQ